MKSGEREPGTARARILEAACRLFAEKGYHGATVSGICREAGVNIAAVNYYFTSKEGLYQDAWKHSCEQVMAKYPPDGGVGRGRPLEERLRGRVRSGLEHAMFGDATFFLMIRNEMANRTGLLDGVVREAMDPVREETRSTLRGLLGPRAREVEVDACEALFMGFILFLTHCRSSEPNEGLAPAFGEESFEEIREFFTRFFLAGIRGLRAPGRAGKGAGSGR